MTKFINPSMTKFILPVFIFIASLPCFAESFTDPRDNQSYQTIKIGKQVWMAQNLNYETGNSWCYDNKSSNCKKQGRLYDWNTAKNACPTGWHLPSGMEFEILRYSVGGTFKNSN